jgi:hypothetical protein
MQVGANSYFFRRLLWPTSGPLFAMAFSNLFMAARPSLADLSLM